MIRILDKNKTPLCGFDDEFDLCIESSISFGDKKLTLEADWMLLKDYVQPEGYIETKTDRYVIKEIKRDSGRTCSIVAQLDLEKLEGKIFRAFASVEQSISDCLALAFAGTGWTVSASSVTKKRTVRMANCSALKIFEQALRTYRCEAVIDSINQTVTIQEQIGQDRGVYFTTDLNLKKLEVSASSYDFYTELEPYGKDGLSIADVNGGLEYVSNHAYSDKVKRAIWIDERYTVAENLLADAEAKLVDMSKPLVSYSASVSDLAKQSSVYSVLEFGLGDVIILSDPITGTRETQRIVGIKEYPKHPEDNSCTLANRQLTFEELSSKYEDTAETVSNVTSDNGTLKGNSLDQVNADKIVNLDGKLITSAVIQNLETEQLNVSGEVTAVKARVGTLEANTASFEELTTEQLNALSGDITILRTQDLTAATGRIGILETSYANIASLLAGNTATGGLTAITLNGQNATIDTAFLKQILANSITVNDLKAGNINTSLFTVGSADGTFRIQDSRLTVKDPNDNVRIQLGLDAQGNYTLYIGNETGTLLDSTGVHENAIADGLVVDRMVKASDGTYNGIEANKLNISSVIGSINSIGGLRDSSIVFSDTDQTLTQVYTQIKSDIASANASASTASRDAQNAVNASQETLSAIAGISTLEAMSMTLTNDAHVVHTEADGTGGDYTHCYTSPSVYLGTTDITFRATITAVPSEGITGAWNSGHGTYYVTALDGDNGYVDFTAVYKASDDRLADRDGNTITDRNGDHITARTGFKMTKRFSVSKALDGQRGVSYTIQTNCNIVKRDVDGSSTIPNQVYAQARRLDNGVIDSYSGIFIVSVSDDDVDFTEIYRSLSPEPSYTWNSLANVSTVRFDLYDATGRYLYARKDIAILADADALGESIAENQRSILSLTTRVGQTETGVDGLRQTLRETTTKVTALEEGSLVSNGERYPNGDGTVTYRIRVYKAGVECTNDFPIRSYSWWRQEDGATESFVSSGYQVTIRPSDYGYDQHLIGLFTELADYHLQDREGNYITDRSGNQITCQTEREV